MRIFFGKNIICGLVLALSLLSNNAQALNHKISPVLAFFPGFGVGHFVEGRTEKGLMFLGLDALATVVVVHATLNNFRDNDGLEDFFSDQLLIGLMGLAFTGFRIWAVVDVLNGPSESAMLLPAPVNGAPGLMLTRRF